MNTTYRIVWSRSQNQLVVASELAKNHKAQSSTAVRHTSPKSAHHNHVAHWSKALVHKACLAALGLFAAGAAYGQASITGPISGNQSFATDTTITLPNTNDNTNALTANNGQTATASNGTVITVIVQGEATDPASGNYGLRTFTGGLIDFSDSKVVVTNSADPASKMAVGVYANGGTILLGDDAEVYALKAASGMAIVSYLGGNVTVGNNAILRNNASGSGTIQAAWDYSSIVIGSGASITNDGSGDSYGAHYGVFAGGSSRIEIGSGSTIQTLAGSTTTNNIGIYASGGTVVMGEDVSISTQGTYSYGITALASSSISGGKITVTTTGNNSYAISALNSSVVNLGADSLITTSGTSGHGINAQSNSQVTLDDDSTIVTSGNSTLGVSSHSGAIVTLGDHVTINTSGQISYGMQSDGDGGASEIHVGDFFVFESSGLRSRGAQTRRGGTIIIGDDAYFSTTGDEATLVYSNEANSVLTIGDRAVMTATGASANGGGAGSGAKLTIGEDASITISGDLAIALYATGAGSETRVGHDATITTSGDQSEGVYATSGGYVFIGDESDVITSGTQSTGLYAYSNAAVIETGTGVTIDTTGDGSYGVRAQPNTTVNLGNANMVSTAGQQAYGLVANGSGAQVNTGDQLQVTATGSDAHAVFALSGGYTSIGEGSTVTTTGTQSTGLYALGDASIITAGNSATVSTTGDASHAVQAEGGQVSLGAGAAISAQGQNAYGLTALDGGHIYLHGATISVDASKTSDPIYASGQNGAGNNAAVTGDGVFNISGGAIVADDNSTIDLTLRDTSLFTGYTQTSATNATNTLALEGLNSRWYITQDSALTTLNLHQGFVDYTAAPLGTRLSVTNLGQMAGGLGGFFVMKTDLLAAQADTLEVSGTTSGTHGLFVVNSGATNTTGSETLPLVYTADTGGSFYLVEPVDIGAWRYGLRQADATGSPWAQSWELYATGEISDAVSGQVNTFSGAYLLSMMENHTLMQRLGDLRANPRAAGLWVRGYGGKFESGARRYVRGFDMDYQGIQIGADYQWNQLEGWSVYTGGMFGYSKGDLDYGNTGNGDVDLKTLGLYATFVEDGGFYVDAVVKYSWMKNEYSQLDSSLGYVTGSDVSTNGAGLSLEVGKRFHFDQASREGFYLEPQLQLSYSHQGSGSFYGSHGVVVHVDSIATTQGRIGTLAGYEVKSGNTPFNVYGKVSYIKEFDGDIGFTANNSYLTDSFGGTRWVYGAGVTARLNEQHSVYVDFERSSGGNFKQPWALNAGWRFSF